MFALALAGYQIRRVRKSPAVGFPAAGLLFWRRPTLAQPIVALPSGLQRLTSVFGMGTGGSTALRSPEMNREFVRDSSLETNATVIDRRNNLQRTADSLTSTYRKLLSAETADATTFRLRFILRSFVSSVCRCLVSKATG